MVSGRTTTGSPGPKEQTVFETLLADGLTARTPKGHRRGAHRWVTPAQTHERVRRLMPAMGMTRVAHVTGLDVIGIPVTMVCRPNARSLAVAQGKGVDRISAEVSGMMESLEHFHAERPALDLRLATFAEIVLDGPVVDLAGLQQWPDSGFHPQLKMLWTQGTDLLQGERVWLPYDAVHLDGTPPAPPGSGCFVVSSHGLASGNHPAEALLASLCEVVERDSVAQWHGLSAAARRATRLDLDSVDSEVCQRLIERYGKAEVDLGVWDVSSDLGVATFYCQAVDHRPNPWRPMPASEGLGCHPSREVALIRALTEAAQTRLTAISGARDDLSRRHYRHVQSQQGTAALLQRLHDDAAQRSYAQVVDIDHETFEEDLRYLYDRLLRGGAERLVAIDLTHPALGIPVVKAVVPGCRGFGDFGGGIRRPRKPRPTPRTPRPGRREGLE